MALFLRKQRTLSKIGQCDASGILFSSLKLHPPSNYPLYLVQDRFSQLMDCNNEGVIFVIFAWFRQNKGIFCPKNHPIIKDELQYVLSKCKAVKIASVGLSWKKKLILFLKELVLEK